MLTFKESRDAQPIARVIGGKNNNKTVFMEPNAEDNAAKGYFIKMQFPGNKMTPLLNDKERQTNLIVGPAGSGKSTYSSLLVKSFRKRFPKAFVYFFSRTLIENDPAYAKLKITHVPIDDN